MPEAVKKGVSYEDAVQLREDLTRAGLKVELRDTEAEKERKIQDSAKAQDIRVSEQDKIQDQMGMIGLMVCL